MNAPNGSFSPTLSNVQDTLESVLIAFVFGSLPLAIASGAGAASRIAIGTAVVGGMVSATVLAIFSRSSSI